MVNTTIKYDHIISIIIVASVPASTRSEPRGQGRGQKILAFEIQQILKAIKRNLIEIWM